MAIIDFHAHILPGADHGSDSTATTLAQLAAMQKAGVEAVVATPHFYPHRERVVDFLQKRDAAAESLFQKISPLSEVPAIYMGAEVLICPGMEEMDGLEELAVKGTDVILLEMPFTAWSDRLIETVHEIPRRGLVPVMAHIDRYPPELVKKLFHKDGLLAQLNAEAFGGFAGGKAYRSYIESGLVVALGSDLHGVEPKCYKPFLQMLKKLGADADAIFSLTEQLLVGAVPLTRTKEKQIAAAFA